MTEHERAAGERMAVDPAQGRDGANRPVDGIDEPTGAINPDSAVDTAPHPDLQALGGSEQGGVAGPVGQFEGEGNEGAVAPLGGDPTKSADDVEPNHQGGAASGAPDTLSMGRS